jgi:hypothetical protein
MQLAAPRAAALQLAIGLLCASDVSDRSGEVKHTSTVSA